jgi:hypothetical protein
MVHFCDSLVRRGTIDAWVPRNLEIDFSGRRVAVNASVAVNLQRIRSNRHNADQLIAIMLSR